MEYRVDISYISNGVVTHDETDFVESNGKYYSDDYAESMSVSRETFVEHNCDTIEIHVFSDEADGEVDPGMYLDIDDYGGKWDYSGDTRTVTMEQLEEILCDCFGGSEYDRSSGCNHNGKWFSIDKILAEVSESIW